MKSLLAVCSLLALAAVVFGLIGLTTWVSGRIQARRRRRFADAIRALGLTLHSDQTASGIIGGVRVRVVIERQARGGGRARPRRANVTRYRAHFDPPLCMGLEIEEPLAYVSLPWLGTEVLLGDRQLERALRFQALEPDRVRALLHDAGVPAATQAASRFGRLTLDDARVCLQHRGWAIEPEAIRRRLEPLCSLVRAIETARRVRLGGRERFERGGSARLEPREPREP